MHADADAAAAAELRSCKLRTEQNEHAKAVCHTDDSRRHIQSPV